MAGNATVTAAGFRKAGLQIPYLLPTLRLIWTATGGRWTMIWLLLLAVEGLLPAATVYLTKALVDAIVEVLRNGGGAARPLWLAAAMAAVLLVSEGLRSALNFVRTAQSELVEDHVQGLVHAKSAEVDLSFYESSEFYDHLHRARSDASFRPVAMLESLGALLQNTVTLVAMGAILLRFGWWMLPLLAICTLPALVATFRCTRRFHAWRWSAASEERRAWYFDWLLTSRDAAAELRLFGLAGHFRASYAGARNRLRAGRLRIAGNQGVAEFAAGVFGLVVMGLAVVWMVYQTVLGRVTLGDLAMFYQAFHQGLRLMKTLLENAGQFYSNILFLGDLYEFLALQPRIRTPEKHVAFPHELHKGIRFRAVCFRYPRSRQFAVRNLNLVIPAGKITAIVGHNGAGKSTLVRLLCRLYDPDEGAVELDGVDIRTLPLEELRGRISALFQEPVRYNTTAAENINVAGPFTGLTNVVRSADVAGADSIIQRLPEGYDSVLGRWFADGVDLSAGEWQRVALARAYFRRTPILILDEPTSAMDPWSEATWMTRLREFAVGQTVIIITHRLTTARHADLIHVMHNGQAAEQGAHEELFELGGLYRQAWEIHPPVACCE